MSDVRDELIELIRQDQRNREPGRLVQMPANVADAIMQRFDVVPKPAVTDVLRWYTAPGDNGIEGAGELADAIMERFDVVPKPAVTDVLRWYTAPGDNGIEGAGELADAIMERFDVVPKPAVTERDMGGMMAYALMNCRSTNVEIAGVHFDEPGRMLLDQLAEAGLMIVRVSDAS